MSNFDDALRRSLTAEDEAFLKDLEDRGLFGQLGAMFEGPMRFWMYASFIMTFVFLVLCILAFWKGVQAETMRETVLYCTVALWLGLAVAMMKLWWWLRMNHLATLRELKKIELRLARLQDGR